MVNQILSKESFIPFMTAVEKEDCTNIETIRSQIGVSRQTLYNYINSLNIQRYRFPFDRKTYILTTDAERIKKLVEGNR